MAQEMCQMFEDEWQGCNIPYDLPAEASSSLDYLPNVDDRMQVKNTFLEFRSDEEHEDVPRKMTRRKSESALPGVVTQSQMPCRSGHGKSKTITTADTLGSCGIHDLEDDEPLSVVSSEEMHAHQHEEENIPRSYAHPEDFHGAARDMFGDSQASLPEGCQTVMVQGLPSFYTQRCFMKYINMVGFFGRYDFLYMPLTAKKCTRGFAFVNFTTTQDAQEFYKMLHGYKISSKEPQPLYLTAAKHQGLEENARQCRRKPSARPLIFQATVEGKPGSGATFPATASGGTYGQAPPASAAEWGNVVTLMVRNLPNAYTQLQLFDEINDCGFEGLFDFMYLLLDVNTGANKGYAFINFLEPEYALTFYKVFSNRKMSLYASNKRTTISVAMLQGYEANRAHYADAPAARPLFLRDASCKRTCQALSRDRRRQQQQHLQQQHQQQQKQQLQQQMMPQPLVRQPMERQPQMQPYAQAQMTSQMPQAGYMSGRVQEMLHGLQVPQQQRQRMPQQMPQQVMQQPHIRQQDNMFDMVPQPTYQRQLQQDNDYYSYASAPCRQAPRMMQQAAPCPTRASIRFCPYCGCCAKPGFNFCSTCGESLDVLADELDY
eukprot:TRINITY_DN10208_c0_g1_i1.p1 TRINITY_DN10208_c0_g1~~TRINITY_DN10208_c0_g1_i1.p1  ORF type:complete len:603 (-),score=177.79 TRINITY_DN10208_c0_g1_i1:151-1959(-)